MSDAYLQRRGPEAAAFWSEQLRIAVALERHYRPAKLNSQTLGNVVPHLHTHLVPRYVDDPSPGEPLVVRTDAPPRDEDAVAEEAAALRALLR